MTVIFSPWSVRMYHARGIQNMKFREPMKFCMLAFTFIKILDFIIYKM
jgi:hypothetical protein